MAPKAKRAARGKAHVCHDMLPKDEGQLLAWAAQAVEINPNNAPEQPAVAAAMLASICITGICDEAPMADERYVKLLGASLTTKRWQPGQEITFGFLRASAQIATRARNAFLEIAKYANLKFRETDASSATIRIADYEQGAWSYLGTDAAGIPRSQQTMNLARSWADAGTAIHEVCHGISLVHEHQSPARPDDFWNESAVYRRYSGPPNNWNQAQIKSNVIDRYSKTQTQYTELDLKSVMLYPLEAELLKNPAYATGWNRVLSAKDKLFLQSLYPFPDAPPPPPPEEMVTITVPQAGTYILKR